VFPEINFGNGLELCCQWRRCFFFRVSSLGSGSGTDTIPAVAATAGSDNKKNKGAEVIATEGTLQCSYCGLISSVLSKLVEPLELWFHLRWRYW
jgi:hypothetical protein